MAESGNHRVVIHRRGRSHRAVCRCGWSSHAWNEPRPAEADAWHHVFGDERIVDVDANGRPVADSLAIDITDIGAEQERPGGAGRARSISSLVRQARSCADSRSPYGRDTISDLWNQAGRDPLVVQGAICEVEELLAQHNRESAGTADSEWLQLITARRVLEEAQKRSSLGQPA